MRHFLEIRTWVPMTLAAAFVTWGCASSPDTVAASPAPEQAPPLEAVVTQTPVPLEACPDRDEDDVCDAEDHCPSEVGPASAFGCPVDPCGGSPLLVRVQFDHDSSAMPSREDRGIKTMDPVLDAVADAIGQDATCRVCTLGHASEEGTTEYNETLSRERAAAVKTYLVTRGLAADRLPTTGLGERCQLVPERSRPLNRRVEFLRLDPGQSCPSDCSD